MAESLTTVSMRSIANAQKLYVAVAVVINVVAHGSIQSWDLS